MDSITLKPAFTENNIPILLTADNNYVPYLSTLLVSMQENCLEGNYDIIVITKNISDRNKILLINQIKTSKNFSLRFIDLTEYIGKINLRVVAYYSEAIYYRLFAPYILVEYDKILYLDCDLVVEHDLIDLWKSNLENNYIAAVRDIGVMLHYYTRDKRQLPLEYFEDTLEGINPEGYFNSGVLIMDFSSFRKNISIQNMVKIIEKKLWNFPDQDILNLLCAEKTYYLPMAWNTVPENTGNRKIKNIVRDVPKIYSEQYLEARNNPYIVHYAMREKPWLYSSDVDAQMSEYFWKYAKKSTYFQDILKKKRSTCTLSELSFILKEQLGLETTASYSSDNVYYTAGKYYVGNLSSIVAKYEVGELNAKNFHIEGYTNFVIPDEAVHVKIALSVNDKRYICRLFDRYLDERVGDKVIGKTVGFKVDIPLDGKTKFYKIDLFVILNETNVRKVKINYGQFFPVDRIIQNQYSYSCGYVLTARKNQLILKKCCKVKRFWYELKYLNTLLHYNDKGARKAFFARLLTFLYKAFNKKKILLIEDNFLADDNGSALFKYIRKKYPRRKVYFVMNKGNENVKRMKKIGKVIYRGSNSFKLLVLRSAYSATSIEDMMLVNPFRKNYKYYRDILNKRKYIFLQHGVIKDDLSREHNKRIYNTQGFITSAKPEWMSLLAPQYLYEKKNVWLTGLPRFDYLYRDEKRYIIIMPTWRKNLKTMLDSEDSRAIDLFEQSDYYKFYFSLLHNKKLLKAAEYYGYKILFKPHPLMMKYENLFLNEDDEVKLFHESYRTTFAQGDLLITDYSSVIFDFVYLKKPVIYAQFDRAEFFSGEHAYTKGYFDYDRDGFGEVCLDLEQTVNTIIDYMRNECKLKPVYNQRINEFFAFFDRNNCERIIDKIYRL